MTSGSKVKRSIKALFMPSKISSITRLLSPHCLLLF
jgi:hypothetical protein